MAPGGLMPVGMTPRDVHQADAARELDLSIAETQRAAQGLDDPHGDGGHEGHSIETLDKQGKLAASAPRQHVLRTYARLQAPGLLVLQEIPGHLALVGPIEATRLDEQDDTTQ